MSRGQSGGRWVVAILLPSLWLGGCGSSGGDGRTDTDPTSGAAAPAPGASGSSSVDSVSVMSLDDLEAGLELLTRGERQHMASCMAERGFPQFAESEIYDTGAEPEARLGTLRIDLLEFGPYTEAQAQKYGIVGTDGAFAKPAPAVILGENPAFNKNVEECRSSVTTTNNGEVDTLNAGLTDFQNRVREEFLALIDDDFSSALKDRIDCLAKAYPAADTEAIMSAGSTEEILALFGIPEGSWSGEEPAQPVVPPGEVIVVPPAPPREYRPSQAEVDVAVAYVQCGDEVDFESRIRAAEDRARGQVLTTHESELIAFTEQYRQAEASLAETAKVGTGTAESATEATDAG